MWRLLFVDPDPRPRRALASEYAGRAEVLGTARATEATRVLEGGQIDLVVLEHRLPDGTGVDLLAGIKARYPRLPVIMSTGHGSEALCAAAFKLGARDYFIKPWVASEVAASITAILMASGQKCQERRNILNGLTKGQRRSAEGDRCVGRSIEQTAQFVRDQCWENLSLERISRDIGISRFAVSRRFKKIMHMSYRRYVLQCRIDRAKELMRQRDHTLTEIAQMVGFSDLPRFDKVFKALVGVPPSLYRRAISDYSPTRNY